MVTMQDVANYAGVSKASVSRVVNGFVVSPKVAQKVTAALEELGYRPNVLARALTTKKNSVIGVIISESLNNAPVVTEFLSQLLERMSQLNKPLIMLNDKHEHFSRLKAFQTLIEQRCEGIVHVSTGNNPYLDSSLFESQLCGDIPMVVIQSRKEPTSSRLPSDENLLVSTTDDGVIVNSIKRQSLSISESINRITSVFSI
ncbi:LacI family DNA-binding transcriptional regulator [Vibrio natriegens]|uniref:LacI family DNA-binding transcriptional regulator n=1 Tax=Vibrio natriegens TaxID=691 RepID=UPI002284065E|nr:LacI family DNA-binding transcriptional regulator [Vibrio natriegens]MCY9876990.1 LacI family DNA-binding transcriptional regulator [Vibrio natriegens]